MQKPVADTVAFRCPWKNVRQRVESYGKTVKNEGNNTHRVPQKQQLEAKLCLLCCLAGNCQAGRLETVVKSSPLHTVAAKMPALKAKSDC